ncbi:hypothetical protein LCGC14_1867300 [marine sediment metagenome]|uniref:Uncharacterized protein n=1 Tax=marine sediment metagenome TaxID=412755 RepID=A0A0F9G621_9ZZZZ
MNVHIREIYLELLVRGSKVREVSDNEDGTYTVHMICTGSRTCHIPIPVYLPVYLPTHNSKTYKRIIRI